MYKQRISKLNHLLKSINLQNLIVTDLENIFYLSGFTGSTAILIVNNHNKYLLIDPRYTLQAKNECNDCQVVEYKAKPSNQALAELLSDINMSGEVGFEADNITFANYNKLKESISDSIILQPTLGLIFSLRVIKDDNEIALIKDAAKIADRTFNELINNIFAGITEKDVANLIESTMKKNGASGECFDTIAAYGENAACPHHSPTETLIQKGSMLKLDFGPKFKHYTADITRTIFIGKPTDKFQHIYEIVLEAQLKAIQAIKPGVTGKDVDFIARDYIESKGYGDNFGHGLGHMIGINVHDGAAFSQTSEVILQPGMAATVEPGIYISGWGGVRLEEDIIVTESGCEVLTGK